jgi:hypothetical protein
MKSARQIIVDGVFVAVLIAGQLALSAVSGIEIVTILFLSFCYMYGVKHGVVVATAFSLIRCIIFGFYANVIVLYLIYYNMFAVFFGLIGKFFNREYSIKKHIIVLISAVVMTALFTLLDNLITPLIYGYSESALKVYFTASLYTLIPQLICSFASTLILFPILIKIFR